MFQSNFNKISILMEIEGNLYGRRPDSIFSVEFHQNFTRNIDGKDGIFYGRKEEKNKRNLREGKRSY